MPNRIINEKIRTSKSINQLSDFQFRLWAYLLTYVDDYGRGSADTELLKGFVFPRRAIREQDIQKGLEALERTGSIQLYTVAGEPYFCFPNWAMYQRIQSKVSKFPEPPEIVASPQNTDRHGDSPCLTVNHRELPLESESNPNPESYIENPNSARANGARSAKAHPTREEVREYCRQRNSPVDPDQFWEYFDTGNWKDSEGKPVLAWKQKLLTWEKNERSRHSSKPASERGSKPADFNDLDKMLDKI